jgi:23S rRNA (uracil1939-C5)-methyltransferase
MASRARELWGIEIVEQAIVDAGRNAALNGIGNAHFMPGDVRTEMRPLVERAGKPDVVLVDPPRAGLSQKIVRRILETEPKKIVYVSCNPTTLAPNARQLAEAGYTLEHVTPVDMFPQTPHIEAVALLTRTGRGV